MLNTFISLELFIKNKVGQYWINMYVDNYGRSLNHNNFNCNRIDVRTE